MITVEGIVGRNNNVGGQIFGESKGHCGGRERAIT